MYKLEASSYSKLVRLETPQEVQILIEGGGGALNCQVYLYSNDYDKSVLDEIRSFALQYDVLNGIRYVDYIVIEDINKFSLKPNPFVSLFFNVKKGDLHKEKFGETFHVDDGLFNKKYLRGEIYYEFIQSKGVDTSEAAWILLHECYAHGYGIIVEKIFNRGELTNLLSEERGDNIENSKASNPGQSAELFYEVKNLRNSSEIEPPLLEQEIVSEDTKTMVIALRLFAVSGIVKALQLNLESRIIYRYGKDKVPFHTIEGAYSAILNAIFGLCKFHADLKVAMEDDNEKFYNYGSKYDDFILKPK